VIKPTEHKTVQARILAVADAIAKTYAWNDRKRMFTPAHIRSAWEALQERGWLGRD
jgi:hypothetical protein